MISRPVILSLGEESSMMPPAIAQMDSSPSLKMTIVISEN
jgi:hypothetical protein